MDDLRRPVAQGVPQRGGRGEVVGGPQLLPDRQDDARLVHVEQVGERGQDGARPREPDLDPTRRQTLHQTPDVSPHGLGR